VRTARDFLPMPVPDLPIALFLAKLPPLPPRRPSDRGLYRDEQSPLRRPGHRIRELPERGNDEPGLVPVHGCAAAVAGVTA
jgi:hypothetical protein